MKQMLVLLTPIMSYIATVLYAAICATIYGYKWVQNKEDMLNEYLVITGLIYTAYILGYIINKRKPNEL